MKTKLDTKKIGAVSKNSIKMIHTSAAGVYKSSPKVVLGVLALLIAGVSYTFFKSTERYYSFNH